MSHQTPSAGADISSTASAPHPPPTKGVDSNDPAWKYCTMPDRRKTYSLKCNYCDKILTSGITRVKYHLACVRKCNAKPCQKVPLDVKQEMLVFLLKSNDAKGKKIKELEKFRSLVNLDHSEGEEESDEDGGKDILWLPSTSGTCSSQGGPMDKFCKLNVEESVKRNQKGETLSEKVLSKLSSQKREEMRNKACEYICQFFYEAGIPHNAVTLPSFACMLEAIGDFGSNLKGPSPYEMSGPFLQKRKKKVMDSFTNHKQAWEHTGCTVMTDAWTDRNGRGVVNLVVHSAHGALFLDSVDCSAAKKSAKYIFDLVDKCIEDIGPEKVVQVVTDNASVNTAAASLMKAKRPSIFWTGCAAHCIDLMLEDIGKLGLVDKTISQARQVTVFLYAHTRVLALMRRTLGRDLVRSGVTRFATAYLNLRSLQDNKREVHKLFRSEELNEMGYLKKDKGKKAHKVVQSESFWKGVDIAVNFFEPMANVLRRMDSDVPAMGFFHGCMLDAKKEISSRFDNDESRFKAVIDIIDKRWDNKLKTPLHLAGYFLNPYYYYPNKMVIEHDGSFRAAIIDCITIMVQDEKMQDDIIDELNIYHDQSHSFGMDAARRQRRNKNFDPAKWWLNHGTSAPMLKNLAIKILTLTCSSSACERNWSAFEQVHAKKRSRLLSDRLRDLVFIKFNSRMKHKRDKKNRDPIEKVIDDVVEDEDNEFITGVVPDDNGSEHFANEAHAQQEASTSQEQARKRKRTAPLKKKRKIIHSLINSMEEDPMLSTSSNSSSSESEDN